MPINDNPYDEKIKLYSRIYRWLLLMLVAFIAVASFVGVQKVFKVGNQIDGNVQLLQEIINSNQRSALEARKANAVRQTEIKDYVKCIVLLRYDNPTLKADSPRTDVEAALDKCAKVE